jgi:hypothetical protein
MGVRTPLFPIDSMARETLVSKAGLPSTNKKEGTMTPFMRFSAILSALGLVAGITASVANANVVTIRDPAFDLPHVCADTDIEAAREQGYQAARDRAAQFLLIMNTARGTIHGALGNLGVDADGDIETRITGYSRNELNLMFNRLSSAEQAIIIAYCEGVNKALNDMLATTPTLEAPLELRFFAQPAVANKDNLFGTKDVLTEGQGADPYYQGLGAPGYGPAGFQFTPELVMAFAVLQIRNFGYEGWDEIGMAEALSKLVTTYGALAGTQLWDDRYWMNDPLAPVSVPDPTAPGFGGPLSKATLEDRIELVKALDDATDVALGRMKLPGYPQRDYSKALEPARARARYREETAKKWGAWPALGSYGWTIAPDRSATGNPWIGGFPQTGIQVPSIMHYTEIRGDAMRGNGMVFVGGPFVLIGHTDKVAYTTTTAHLKMIDQYIEELDNGDYDLFLYDHHGNVEPMSKRIELVHQPNGGPLEIPVFRTNAINGNGGDRPVLAFSGDVAGNVTAATGTSITDSGVSLTPGALTNGYLAIVAGKGAGQMRQITGNTGDTITVGVAFATTPDNTSEYVAAEDGNVVTAVSFESVLWLGEGAAAAGFSRYQKAQDILDVREAVRAIPSTHNFFGADNNPYNGIGTDHGNGNIYYATSGLKRVRQLGPDPRLPIDGTQDNTFVVVNGVVGSSGPSSLTANDDDFDTFTFTAAPINFTYDNPGDNGSEYVVAITSGTGYRQVRRVVSNTANTLTLEDPWGTLPANGDTYEVYEVWATPEALNPSEGFTANWNNKQAKANEIMLSQNGRNHRVEAILEQLSTMTTVDRDQLRDLNKYVAGVVEPGNPGRYLLTRLAQAIAAEGDCGDVDDALLAQAGIPEKGREFTNPLFVAPSGETIEPLPSSGAPDYVKGWATQLAVDIYGDEYDPAAVSKLTSDRAIGWAMHAIDDAAGDLPGSYANVYTGDYFNGTPWTQVVRDSFCNYVSSHPTIDDKARSMQNYNHPLAALPCGSGQICSTPISFDPVPFGNRGTWEQIVEVGSSVQGEFVFPLGQSGQIEGFAAGFTGSGVHQKMHTSTLQPLWRDWRFAPMLKVCEDVDLDGDADGDTDNDGVLDGFEKWYYGSLANGGNSDTDGDGADLQTEYRWGSDPTVVDTDQDGVADGSDVAPQDRLCVAGALKKMSVADSATPLKDKVSAKWRVAMKVCVGGDYETACNVDADCGGAGRCKRINLDPTKNPIRIVFADNSPLFDVEIPISASLWKAKIKATDDDNNPATPDKLTEKYTYADKEAVNGPVAKMKVALNDLKGTLDLQVAAKNLDLPVPPDDASGVVGIMIGSRCFTQTTTNCKLSGTKLSCKE